MNVLLGVMMAFSKAFMTGKVAEFVKRERRLIASAAWFNRHLKETYTDPVPDACQQYPDGIAALHIKALDDRFLFFKKDTVVVDFGCYPG